MDEVSLERWCEVTTFHGIWDLWESPNLICKALWMLMILTSMGYMTYEIHQIVSEFINQDKWTTKLFETANDNLTFPPIAICNFNRISSRKAAVYKFDGRLIEYLFATFGLNYLYEYTLTDDDGELFEKWRNERGFDTWESIFDNLGSVSCNETIATLKIGHLFQSNSSYLCDSQRIKESFVNGTSNETWYVTLKMIYSIKFGQCIQLDFNPETVRVNASGKRSKRRGERSHAP